LLAEREAAWARRTYAGIAGEPWDQRVVPYSVNDASLDDSYEYTLPFSAGFGYRVLQGPYGSFSHAGLDATDFAMPVGTPVCAARDGSVVVVIEVHAANGPLGTPTNSIRVLHEDGTVAEYAHLVQGGALVHVGDHVVAGECIGFSGNTGFSTEPHLHFMVIHGAREGSPARAIRFRTASTTRPTLLVPGYTYVRPWIDDDGVMHRVPLNALHSCELREVGS
jgi:murein DD-endopeptidase MepM/ murein hydrolase activator NlpD